MSEPVSKQRNLPVDGGDLRAARPGSGMPTNADPLAELARLVGREDPFRDLFAKRDPRRTAPATAPERQMAHGPAHADFDEYPSHADDQQAGLPGDGRETPFIEFRPSLDANLRDALDRPDDGFEQPRSRRDALRFAPMPSVDQSFAEPREPGFERRLPEGEAPPLNADLWAQGMAEPVSAEPMDYLPEGDEPAHDRGSMKRTLIVMASVLALTAGGLGATFMVRGGTHGTAGSGTPPTIMADAGPTKVQPPDTSNAATGGEGTTALLEKSASDNVNNAKVVNTQERPIDLAQLPKASQPTAPINDGRVETAPNTSPFPEPKKVKTILVRPDGSVVGESPAPAPTAVPPSSAVAGVAMPAVAEAAAPASAGPTEAVVAKPATPKSTARVTTTPKSTATPADGVAAVKPKPAHATPKPKPVETADATATTPTDAARAADPAVSAPAGSGYAVQLAAPGSEKEAKDVMARLEKKYADALGDKTPGIRKADKGDKSVYRVRVGNLSQDEAKALCSKLQASGGSCFVVHN